MAEQMTGTVKWFNSEKGFGFIHQKRKQRFICTLSSSKHNGYGRVELSENQRVSFNVGQGQKVHKQKTLTFFNFFA
jgi:CspA family cold shock protein